MQQTQFGRYVIVSELGRGAMGAVHRAVDPLIERDVAIKTLLPNLPPEIMDEVRERFLREARSAGRTIFTCGNGGSASTASHFVCDIVKGASFGRTQRFRIQALTDSLPTLTAYSNDVGYEIVFVEQLKNFAQAGDVVLAISGSGNSPNVIRAVEYANSIGCRTIGLTGREGGMLAHSASFTSTCRTRTWDASKTPT